MIPTLVHAAFHLCITGEAILNEVNGDSFVPISLYSKLHSLDFLERNSPSKACCTKHWNLTKKKGHNSFRCLIQFKRDTEEHICCVPLVSQGTLMWSSYHILECWTYFFLSYCLHSWKTLSTYIFHHFFLKSRWCMPSKPYTKPCFSMTKING